MLLLDEDKFAAALEIAAVETERRIFTRPHTMTGGEVRTLFEDLLLAAAAVSSTPPTPAAAPAPDGDGRTGG